MDIEEYLASLENDEQLNVFTKEEDGLKPGLLSELQMEAPEELHNIIMKTVRNETAATIPVEEKVSKERSNKYKIYMPLIAAAALFVVFIGNVNFHNSNNQIATNPVIQEHIYQRQPNENKTISEDNKKVLTAKKYIENKKDNRINLALEDKKVKSDLKAGTHLGKKQNNMLALNLKTIGTESKSTSAKTEDIDDNNIIVSVSDASSRTMQKDSSTSSVNKDSKNNYKESTNLVVASNYTDDMDMGSDGRYSSNYMHPSLDYNYEDNALFAMSYTYNEDADYEVTLYMNQTDVINYIYKYGDMIGANVYKFKMQDFYSLKQLLASKNINITNLSNKSSASDYINLRVMIN